MTETTPAPATDAEIDRWRKLLLYGDIPAKCSARLLARLDAAEAALATARADALEEAAKVAEDRGLELERQGAVSFQGYLRIAAAIRALKDTTP